MQSATWNGAALNKAYVPAGALASGGTLGFAPGTSANTAWASGAADHGPSTGTATVNSRCRRASR